VIGTRPLRRRSLLRIVPPLALGGALAALLPFHGHAQQRPALRVGYISIIPMAQLFVMEGRGWTKDAGLPLITKRFASGPAMLEALAMGALDVAYIGIGPAMLARARGVAVKVVAANVMEQVALVARGPLAVPSEESPSDRFRRIRMAANRPVRIATLPRGSVPDTVLRYYLMEVAHIDLADVQIIGVGEDEVQRMVLDGSADAASIVEPILSFVLEHDRSARVIAHPHQMMPNHPGAVVLATSEIIAQNREAITKLVALHIKAADFARAYPERATNDIVEYLGRGLIDPAIILKALTSDATRLIADPRSIVAATHLLQEFDQRLGSPAAHVDVDALFDFSFYDAAMRP
jgi:NitT/TauT family transport system substrate-binding protein